MNQAITPDTISALPDPSTLELNAKHAAWACAIIQDYKYSRTFFHKRDWHTYFSLSTIENQQGVRVAIATGRGCGFIAVCDNASPAISKLDMLNAIPGMPDDIKSVSALREMLYVEKTFACWYDKKTKMWVVPTVLISNNSLRSYPVQYLQYLCDGRAGFETWFYEDNQNDIARSVLDLAYNTSPVQLSGILDIVGEDRQHDITISANEIGIELK